MAKKAAGLTRVKELWVFPFLLIVVEGPQVDDDSRSFLHCKVPEATEEHTHRMLRVALRVTNIAVMCHVCECT